MRLPWVTAALALFMGLATSAGWQEALALAPPSVLREPWRLATWPLVHGDLSHLLWDGLAFVVLGALVEAKGRWRFALLLCASALLSGVVWCTGREETLLGASGMDSALFVAAALDLLGSRRGGLIPRVLGGAAAMVFLGKLLVESTTGNALFYGGATAWSVHATSAVAGGVVWFLFWVSRKQPRDILLP